MIFSNWKINILINSEKYFDRFIMYVFVLMCFVIIIEFHIYYYGFNKFYKNILKIDFGFIKHV